jgi:trimeric autotransporter adhesin
VGYTLAGWTETDGGSSTVTFPYAPATSSTAEPITLYAKWTATPYAVTYNSKGGTAVPSDSFSILNTSIAQPTAPTKAGYTFEGWTETDGGSTLVQFPHTPSPATPITLYAKWTANTNVVTFDTKGGTAVSNGSFTTGGSIDSAPTAPTRDCSVFAGWSATDGGALVEFPYSPWHKPLHHAARKLESDYYLRGNTWRNTELKGS